ncbi:ABC transporter substrate-binding protein [Ancylobacter polymorphus]|uniref:NitT/TauT family transport system substrate-binding protein n=1 Tax=Ancylobacter polymorphus TaxID=223390 RepID=A0ABU0BHQ5_9HYPH|nr:ABC transporter substrate-binding protein [Ancylobacter polymorphus]MDQ0304841.1 NitT/TauT family transport system substrate-binding protein [Ancylobacter polymorphus]
MLNRRQMLGGALIASAAIGRPAAAQIGRLTVASTQQGNWDTSVAELAQRAGIFKKHALDVNVIWSYGGGETLQAVLSGSADVGTAIGVMAVLGAFSKGAPVRIIGNEQTGAADLFWYVRTDSPIRSLADINGKTIAYSANGSSSHSVVMELTKTGILKATPVATGGAAATLTQVLSGQIAVGWSAPPFGLAQLDRKEIRILLTGDDARGVKERTSRVNIANLPALLAKRNQIERFASAYRETIDWMYESDDALKIYAEFAHISIDDARRIRKQFFPKSVLDPDVIHGIDQLIEDAVSQKYITAALDAGQIRQLIQIPPR